MSDRRDPEQDFPIFERVKTIVPDVTVIATALDLRDKDAERIRQKLVIILAELVDMSEAMNQAVTDFRDVTSAQTDVVNESARVVGTMEDVADKNAGARTILRNMVVWIMSHEPTIRYFYEVVRIDKTAEAARKMKKSRVLELVDALLRGAEFRR